MRFCAKISAVNRNNWEILTEDNKFLKATINNKYQERSLPIVGDNVECIIDKFENVFIISHKSRNNLLKRKYNGKEQLMACNIDVVFIVTSLNKEFQIAKIERLVAIAMMTKAKIFFILTKKDMCNNLDFFTNVLENRFPNISYLIVDSIHNDGVDLIFEYWKAGQTAIFIGSSGVGKSTLINALLNKDIMKTNQIREKDCKGKHTTTSRQLLLGPQGRLVIDTPGIRSVLITNDNDETDQLFSDIIILKECCKFNNCTHSPQEVGCAVQSAIKNGVIDADIYDRYLKMIKKKDRLEFFLHGQQDMKEYEKIRYCKLKKKARRNN